MPDNALYRNILALAISCALSGCYTAGFYAAEDPALSAAGAECGSPHAWWRTRAAGITASIAAERCPQGLCGLLRLEVPGASRVSFAGNSIAVADAEQSGSIPLRDGATDAAVAAGTRVPPAMQGRQAADYSFAGPAPTSSRLLLAAPLLDVDGRHASLPVATMVLVVPKTTTPCNTGMFGRKQP